MKVELRIQQYHRWTDTHTHTEWLLELLVGAKKVMWWVVGQPITNPISGPSFDKNIVQLSLHSIGTSVILVLNRGDVRAIKQCTSKSYLNNLKP